MSTVLVSLGTGEVAVLARGVRQGQGEASFSPDGRYVVFSDVEAGAADEDLFVMEIASGR
ncbi:MAG: hypothetical protein GWN32_17635, partial [Gemmatimonadetes bacterium]|nr:hypothetical protein [Gemmatimonadota bacterium]